MHLAGIEQSKVNSATVSNVAATHSHCRMHSKEESKETQDELVNIIYMAEATQRLALHNNDKASRA